MNVPVPYFTNTGLALLISRTAGAIEVQIIDCDILEIDEKTAIMADQCRKTLALLLLCILVSLCNACHSHTYKSGHPETEMSLSDEENISGSNHYELRADEEPDLSLERRWYGVEDLEALRAEHSLNKVGHAPWPKQLDCGNHQWLRYCFIDEDAADNLLSILAHAILIWTPAFQYSGLSIQPDTACFDPETKLYDYRCICGAQKNGRKTAGYALLITDNREENDKPETWSTVTESTLGYDYRSDKKERHHIYFGHVNVFSQPLSGEHFDILVRSMAHELGKLCHMRLIRLLLTFLFRACNRIRA